MKTRLLTAATLLAATAVPLLPGPGTPTVGAVSCTVTTLLMPGTTNAAVTCLEQRLAELGYTVGTPDTFYDATTLNAVKFFQTSRGLYADGVVTSIVSRQLGLRGGPLPSGPSVAKVTVIGDSTSAAMRWTDEQNNNTARYDVLGTTYDLQWALESCRRLVTTSCLSRTNTFTNTKIVPTSALPLMQGALKGRLGNTLVIMAGYDDYSIAGAIDPIMAEARAQGVTRVFWLNYRLTSNYNAAYQGYYTQHNANLAAAALRWPNLTVLDWNGYTHGQSSSTQAAWFYTDGIHMTPAGATALANFIKAAIDGSDVPSCTAGNANTGSAEPNTGTPPAPAPIDTGFVAQGPTRLFDSRNPDLGGGNGKVGAGRTVVVNMPELPANTEAAVVNVTAALPCQQGYLTVYACGIRPATSNVNYVAGRTTAGVAISRINDNAVCVYTSAAAHIVVDLVGVFAQDGAAFHPMAPTRWVDTRGNPAQVAIPGPLASGGQVDVPIAGVGAVPADVAAVWLNLTSVGSPTGSVVQVYPGPCGTPPSTSTVNTLPGRAAATTALVQIGGNGGICVRAFSGTPHVVLDVSGWFGGAAPDGLAFRLATPSRPIDTRAGAPVAGGDSVPLTVTGPTVLNVAAVAPVAAGFVTVRPCGSTNTTSLLNVAGGEPGANMGAVGPGTGGQVCISPSTSAHLVVDVVGTFAPPAAG